MRICLSRLISYHLVQTYIPSIIFVTLSWLSLFVSPEMVPGNYFDTMDHHIASLSKK